MSTNKNLWLATASAVVLFTAAPAFAQQQQPNVTVVQPEGPAEQTGKAVDNAAGQAADAASNAANQASQAAESAADKASQAADNAGEAANNAANQAADAADAATDTETAEAPVQGQIFEQSPDQYLASTLLDAVVMNPAGEEIGDVNDMIVSKDGKVQGVVIGAGGFLGIGEKNVAVELSRLQITEDDNDNFNFTLDASAEELTNAPEFMTQEDQASEAEANSATPTAGAGAGMTTAPAAGTAPATAQ